MSEGEEIELGPLERIDEAITALAKMRQELMSGSGLTDSGGTAHGPKELWNQAISIIFGDVDPASLNTNLFRRRVIAVADLIGALTPDERAYVRNKTGWPQ
ncbi:MAG TPA: hypothetical protein VJG48_01345 [Candidatus Paceibacterota bacterium]